VKVVIDVEANRLVNPDKIWCIVCKCIDTGKVDVFRKVTDDHAERQRFHEYAASVSLWIGHNILGWDRDTLISCIDFDCGGYPKTLDTLIVSKLVDYSRQGHSIEDYGIEFGYHKDTYSDFSKYSQELENRCVRDVEIGHKIYNKYSRYVNNNAHTASLALEHQFQLVVNQLHNNGFSFDNVKAGRILARVEEELAKLDVDILEAFPPRLKLIREIHPKETKYGTLSKTDFRWHPTGDLSEFNGGPFSRCSWECFNPSSHKQIVNVLSESGWRPVDKTQSHIDKERELNRLRYNRGNDALDITKKELILSLDQLKKTGWKVNEVNLETLPSSAPKAARLLAKRILLESRRRTLTEWLALVDEDENRIHGRFYGIGAWTHRMAHQAPNTANIPNEYDTAGKKKLLGKELRSLWCAPKNRLLVGVDAEGIQLRIFAHLINDPEFTDALVKGKKDDKTDPHSLNQRILGSVCRSRAAAKRFIYALLLGAGMSKLAEILGCSESEAKEALGRLMDRYSGWATLKSEVFPTDARRGWFTGLDGRKVKIPGDTEGGRRHLAMSGYLQNGEAVCMKLATMKWVDDLKDYDALLVNFVHDEWQVECPNNMEIALSIARMMAGSLEEVGNDLKLNCPLAGSYWNDDLKDYTIATNWSKTH
jgi:DNA polymerase I